MNAAKTEAVANANAHLNNAGLPTYTELVGLLLSSARLGLNFDIGNAYIRRDYITAQDALQKRIRDLKQACEGTMTFACARLLENPSE